MCLCLFRRKTFSGKMKPFFLESYVIFPLFGSARENELENVFWCLGGAANY